MSKPDPDDMCLSQAFAHGRNLTKRMNKSLKRIHWTVTNERTRDVCTYSSAHGHPVTSDHVRRSPAVIRWAAGDPVSVDVVVWVRDHVLVRKTNE